MANRSVGVKIAMRVTKGTLHVFLNIIFYLLVLMLIIKIGTFTYDFAYQVFGDVSVTESAGIDREFIINKGESTMSIASKLELNKLIVDKYSFYLRAKLTEQLIKPGTYILNSSMNYEEILAIITTDDGTNSTDMADTEN